ncbi:hypothetical protein IQ06DRAFT_61845 [Phaeosphaeriaceae sp. SRC1lsM3a]|nr:hypothetical protein IQ06DRAFT_61845 [Stagonospora sp. SRC1lsM3a]
MQLPTISLAVLAMANAVAAVGRDYVETNWRCTIFPTTVGPCTGAGRWHNEYGQTWEINASDGCRSVPVTGITQVCFDWKNGRGHFLAANQPKRCLSKGPDSPDYYCGPGTDAYRCVNQVWTEVTCTW